MREQNKSQSKINNFSDCFLLDLTILRDYNVSVNKYILHLDVTVHNS